MKLHELLCHQSSLVEDFEAAWQKELLSEGMIEDVKNSFLAGINAFAKIISSSNRKGSLNDTFIRSAYQNELAVVKEKMQKINPKAQQAFSKLLTKNGVVLGSGVDLSRNNLNRYGVVLAVSALLYLYLKLPENAMMSVLDLITTGGVATAIAVVANAKDAKEIGQGMIRTSKEAKRVFDQAKSQ